MQETENCQKQSGGSLRLLRDLHLTRWKTMRSWFLFDMMLVGTHWVSLKNLLILLSIPFSIFAKDAPQEFESFELECSGNSVVADCRKKRQVEEGNLTVAVEQGLLRGRRLDSVTGETFIAYSGIPYAKPPIGPLRFKDAERPEQWNGIRDAFEEGNICPQPSSDPTQIIPTVIGNEDCLYVNIYTPQLPPLEKGSLAVVVLIHGGGFILGNANIDTVGPDYLLSEEIVVVTLNYRLGVFGFLYLNEAAPGNVGLKDQVAALRWIKRNIAAFGGDSNKITIFGGSAGSASVQYLMLSPMSRGLYRAAVAVSGLAIDRWAIQTAPLETSRRLAAAVSCPTGNDTATVNCLRETPPELLISAALTSAPTQFDKNRLISYTFVPTVDLKVPGVETFLPDHPLNLLRRGHYNHVPFITGFTNNESVSLLAKPNILDENVMMQIDQSWNITILPELDISENCSTNEEALRALRKFFMDGQPLTRITMPKFLIMLTDIFFGKGVYYSVHLMGKYNRAPVYEYIFTVNDALNTVSQVLAPIQIEGAGHGDDFGYLLRMSGLPDVSRNSTAWKKRQQMVRMYSNFVKYRDPTPFPDPLLEIKWRPYSKHQENFLEIGSELKPGRKMNAERVRFWNNFYRQYHC